MAGDVMFLYFMYIICIIFPQLPPLLYLIIIKLFLREKNDRVKVLLSVQY